MCKQRAASHGCSMLLCRPHVIVPRPWLRCVRDCLRYVSLACVPYCLPAAVRYVLCTCCCACLRGACVCVCVCGCMRDMLVARLRAVVRSCTRELLRACSFALCIDCVRACVMAGLRASYVCACLLARAIVCATACSAPHPMLCVRVYVLAHTLLPAGMLACALAVLLGCVRACLRVSSFACFEYAMLHAFCVRVVSHACQTCVLARLRHCLPACAAACRRCMRTRDRRRRLAHTQLRWLVPPLSQQHA